MIRIKTEILKPIVLVLSGISEEQALQQEQQAKALLLAGEFTKEELEAEGLA